MFTVLVLRGGAVASVDQWLSSLHSVGRKITGGFRILLIRFASVIIIRSDAIRSDAIRSEAIRSEAIRSDAIRSDAIRSDAIRSDAIRSDAIRSDAMPSDDIRALYAAKPRGSRRVNC